MYTSENLQKMVNFLNSVRGNRQARGGRQRGLFDPNAAIGMKDAYKDYFKIGVAVNRRNVSVPDQMQLIQKEFNSITAENTMKPISVHPKEGVWNWGGADSVANYCRENGIPLRGHCLCWHSQFTDWMLYDKKGRLVK
jgi:GH35 family endo-1,4-beta-xylanase